MYSSNIDCMSVGAGCDATGGATITPAAGSSSWWLLQKATVMLLRVNASLILAVARNIQCTGQVQHPTGQCRLGGGALAAVVHSLETRHTSIMQYTTNNDKSRSCTTGRNIARPTTRTPTHTTASETTLGQRTYLMSAVNTRISARNLSVSRRSDLFSLRTCRRNSTAERIAQKP